MVSRRILSFTLGVLATLTAHAGNLREELILARENKDLHAQIELARRILEKEPRDAELRETLADLWLAIPDYDMAEKALKEWPDAPERTKVRVTADIIYYRDGDKAGGIRLLEEYHAKTPDDGEMTRQLADFLKGAGENARIVAVLDSSPGVGNDADLLATRALARRDTQDFEKALADFAKAEAAGKDELVVRNNRASFERLQEALPGLKASSAVLEKDPANVPALLSRAYWYQYTGLAPALALADAEAARKASPDSTAALLIYAKAAREAGTVTAGEALKTLSVDTDRALPSLEILDHILQADAALAANAKDVKALLGRSCLLNDRPGQYTLALRDAEAALAIEPHNPTARLEKLHAQVKLHNYDKAAEEFRAMQQYAKAPAYVQGAAAGYLADAAFRDSRFDLALQHINAAIAAEPIAKHFQQRAAILQRLNREADARADLARAAALEKKPAR